MARRDSIGRLDRRITIERPVESRSATGQELLTWVTWCSTWAAVSHPKTGADETVVGDVILVTTRVDFEIRYRTGLTEKMRIRYNGSLYNILNIAEDGRKERLLVSAQKQE